VNGKFKKQTKTSNQLPLTQKRAGKLYSAFRPFFIFVVFVSHGRSGSYIVPLPGFTVYCSPFTLLIFLWPVACRPGFQIKKEKFPAASYSPTV